MFRKDLSMRRLNESKSSLNESRHQTATQRSTTQMMNHPPKDIENIENTLLTKE